MVKIVFKTYVRRYQGGGWSSMLTHVLLGTVLKFLFVKGNFPHDDGSPIRILMTDVEIPIELSSFPGVIYWNYELIIPCKAWRIRKVIQGRPPSLKCNINFSPTMCYVAPLTPDHINLD